MAVTLAAATLHGVTAALGVAIVIAAGIAVLNHPPSLLLVLATSVYLEVIKAQGTTISRMLAPLALVTILVQLVRGRASIRVDRPLGWATAYAVLALASGIWTTTAAGTLYLLASLAIALVYMVAFASLLDSRRDLERLLVTFALASLLAGVLSFPRVSETLHFGRVLQAGRSQGGVGDPNFFAALQLVTLPIVIVAAAEARKRRAQIGLYATALVSIGSILTALSRAGFIGLAVLLVLLVLAPFRFLFGSRRNKAIALVILAIGFTGSSIRHSSTLTSRVETIWGHGKLAAQQGSGRIDLWKAADTSVAERPWLGLGYGAFPSASNALLLQTPGVDLSVYAGKKNGEPVHNTYLESLVELGVAGPVLYVALLLSTAGLLRRTARRALRADAHLVARVAHALLLSLSTWAITSIFMSGETSRPLWIVVGLTLALPKLIPRDEMRAAASVASP
jgi:putative inorganic carbon (HCO3(-)) transporter